MKHICERQDKNTILWAFKQKGAISDEEHFWRNVLQNKAAHDAGVFSKRRNVWTKIKKLFTV